MSYGVSPSLTKKRLGAVPPLAIAAGSQVAAALMLAVPAALFWPEVAPSSHAWLMAGLLAIFGTGFAYVLYFRLIANAGPSNAVAVTYLIPLFAVLWGGVFLGERLTLSVVLGCAVIFVGTALATGVLVPRAMRRERARSGCGRGALIASSGGRRGRGHHRHVAVGREAALQEQPAPLRDGAKGPRHGRCRHRRALRHLQRDRARRIGTDLADPVAAVLDDAIGNLPEGSDEPTIQKMTSPCGFSAR